MSSSSTVPTSTSSALENPRRTATTPSKTSRTTVNESPESFGGTYQAYQSNYEGAIVERIHQAKDEGIDGIVINAGAYTHTSVAIRDALLGTMIPFIQLHISNVHAREEFRHKSYLSDKAKRPSSVGLELRVMTTA